MKEDTGVDAENNSWENKFIEKIIHDDKSKSKLWNKINHKNNQTSLRKPDSGWIPRPVFCSDLEIYHIITIIKGCMRYSHEKPQHNKWQR